MTLFPLVAAALALVTALIVLGPLLIGRRTAETRDARDAALYRDQMTEIERDLARGTISAQEAAGAKTEIARRLLAAADRAETATPLVPAPAGRSRRLALGLLVALPLGAGFVYAGGAPLLRVLGFSPETVAETSFIGLTVGGVNLDPIRALGTTGVGRPDLPDRPLAERPGGDMRLAQTREALPGLPSQAEAESRADSAQPEPSADVEKLRTELVEIERRLETQPEDPRLLQARALALGALGRHAESWRAWDRLIRVSGPKALGEWLGEKAVMMVEAGGGIVSVDAALAISEALARDPGDARMRYYQGVALLQAGRPEEGLEVWKRLRADAPAGAPWIGVVDRAIARLTSELVAAGRIGGEVGGPGPDDIAAAQGLDAGEQANMIEGMVKGLEDRLFADGGPPEKWLQLINSYRVLGRTDAALRVLTRALEVFGEDSETGQWLVAQIGDIAEPPTAAPLPPPPAVATPAPGPIRGPSAGDIAAAQQMTPDERRQMIEGMVARLEERLTGEGGEATDWVGLVRSYMMLGRKDDARRIYDLGQTKLKGQDAGFLREQALLLGVIDG